ncbi:MULTISPECIES: superoxide dismutase family protein [unclassified Psychrobacillus]|uniref:superoxide dismutase family protein n=1 Tax=unclassified Psychrobacillus TaxID=2636677 RepID=UPI00203CB031|nr:superoxide dismutase family protein [uncultured Psychrobacillus sp.]MCM3358603.1 superoxide dismutase family protein [Psychrobacillus sp. MER TA 171]
MYKHITVTLVITSVLLAGCSFSSVDADKGEMVDVSLMNSEGKQVGTATLSETSKGTHILLKAEGLAPGIKAIHFHEKASCEKPTFESAGGHFNPTGKEHGFQNHKGYHAGDLPNIEIDKDGTVELETISPAVVLTQGKSNSLLDADGSAIVIHESADDYKTDPAGNSGKRIVCGEIKK